MKYIDLRSDTVTQPTPEMRQAMLEAPLGDDVYGDDPTVNQLEEKAAALLGKEAAVFVPTGTMGNQASIMAHTRPGEEIIAGMYSHIIHFEAGGPSRLSGVSTALSNNEDGRIYAEDIQRLVRPLGNVHFPRTSLLCLENALGNGDVVTIEQMKAAYETAKVYNLKVHLDGARIFNAAAALGVEAREIAAYTDSLSFCLSKGLCAPAGSMVCGEADFIQEVRRCRKVLGGGMRQTGILAACGLVALDQMVPLLADDHENALYLARRMADMPQVRLSLGLVKINMVFWRHTWENFNDDEFLDFMIKRNIKVSPSSGGLYRLVTHHDVSRADIDKFLAALSEFTAALGN